VTGGGQDGAGLEIFIGLYRMIVPRIHNMTKEVAKRQVERRLLELMGEYRNYASNPRHCWHDDMMAFSSEFRGSTITGTIHVSETMVTVDLGIPFEWRIFEGRIRSEVERGLRDIFPH